MAKDVRINGETYYGVSRVEAPLAASPSENAVFVEESETANDFIVTLKKNANNTLYRTDKTDFEIWEAVRRGDAIWYRMGNSMQRAVVIYNNSSEIDQVNAVFVGNFERGSGIYNVFLVSGVGLIVEDYRINVTYVP